MINYKKISEKSSNIAHFQDIYLDNFPDCERREWEDVLNLMQDEQRFHIVAAVEEGLLIGFVSYWTLGGFNYVEHLAVEGRMRGRGIGGNLLRQVTSVGLPVLLEVEPPVDEATRHRVAFYERQGLVLHESIDYIQPPYSPGKPSVPLMLMTTASMSDQDTLHAIPQLYREVYHYWE